MARAANKGGRARGAGGATRPDPRFNFLERLLILCAHPRRSVPEEDDVRFQISSKDRREALCAIFQIDWSDNRLMTGIRPDYLALYAGPTGTICTIIELKKGRQEADVKHGVRQIIALHDRLKQEIATCLPRRCRGSIKMQGVLLTPYNVELPGKLIDEQDRKGFPIVALTNWGPFELLPYVRRLLSTTDRYRHVPDREPEAFSLLERILTRGAQQVYVPRQGDGIRVKYASEDDRRHGTLAAEVVGAEIALGEQDRGFCEQIRRELLRIGVTDQDIRLKLPE